MSENDLFMAEMRKLSKANTERMEREKIVDKKSKKKPKQKKKPEPKPLVGIEKALWNIDEIQRLLFKQAGGSKWGRIKVLLREIEQELKKKE